MTEQKWQIVHADVTEWLAEYDGPPFHAVLCDPPYGLSKEPDTAEVLSHWLAGDDYHQSGDGEY
jgi:site-specific DNA-methyltransferase (adenine-specific)